MNVCNPDLASARLHGSVGKTGCRVFNPPVPVKRHDWHDCKHPTSDFLQRLRLVANAKSPPVSHLPPSRGGSAFSSLRHGREPFLDQGLNAGYRPGPSPVSVRCRASGRPSITLLRRTGRPLRKRRRRTAPASPGRTGRQASAWRAARCYCRCRCAPNAPIMRPIVPCTASNSPVATTGVRSSSVSWNWPRQVPGVWAFVSPMVQ